MEYIYALWRPGGGRGNRTRLEFHEDAEGDAMLDSPFEFCVMCREYVLLDQTTRQCAREHRCDGVAKCPLQKYFIGIEFREWRQAVKAKRSKG